MMSVQMFTMEFGKYDVVPQNIAKDIAENKK